MAQASFARAPNGNEDLSTDADEFNRISHHGHNCTEFETEIQYADRKVSDPNPISVAYSLMSERRRKIFRGEPRIGKTRFLDEIAQSIPAGVQCNYISLTMDNAKVDETIFQLYITPS